MTVKASESNDEDEPSANAAGQNVINIENDAESNEMNHWLGKSQKIPFY